LIDAIARARPLAIGVDLLFVEPDRSAPGADAALADAVRAAPVVLGIAGLSHRDRRYPFPPQSVPVRMNAARELPLVSFDGHLQSRPEINRAASGRGLISADSTDRVVRRVPLVARIGRVIVPALSAETLRVAIGSPPLRIEDRGGENVVVGLGEVAIPVQADGTMQVYFGPHDEDRFVAAEEVLSGRAAPELFRDKLVLIGVTGLGLLDYQATPLGERVPGVEIHAQMLEQMFDSRFLRRPTGAAWMEAALLACVGLLLVFVVPRARVWLSAAVVALAVLALAAGGVLAFKAGFLLNVAGPMLGTLAVFGGVLAATYAEADRQRRLLREAQARVAGELEAARRIQMGLLPAPRKLFAGEARFGLEALLEPARTVGGDFYDCFMIDRHRLFFAVADVSGKGLPASLFMALSKSLLKSIALRADSPDPGTLFMRANAEISRDNPEALFVTAFAGILDLRTGALAFCNAGHEPPLVCAPGGALAVLEHAGGPPLCVMDGYEYPTGHRTLSPGEWLCVVTDGVTEAMNPRRELYGAARLRAVLERHCADSPQALVAAVGEDVRAFADGADQSDDVTLLCVRWNGDAAAGLVPSGEEDVEEDLSIGLAVPTGR
ncbi:MAG TPA: SpoIIE family protein phosphatase, partial [Burkholderiales bacterium]|nr:SpoIIE family protein phosphatase [Burkholderiales bacterium]